MVTQSVRHGPHRAAPGSGLRPIPIQSRQPKPGEAEPSAEPWGRRFRKKPAFLREKGPFSSKRITPTGNAACLGIGRHSLASNAWSFPPCSRCASLHLAGSDPQRSVEPSAEPSAQTSIRWPQNRPPAAKHQNHPDTFLIFNRLFSHIFITDTNLVALKSPARR